MAFQLNCGKLILMDHQSCIFESKALTLPQLLEGLKEEFQVEDIRKREEVGARSLTRSTRGVEGRAGAPGLGLGRVTSLIHLLEPASNQPQSG
jgi:hypothetical protein